MNSRLLNYHLYCFASIFGILLYIIYSHLKTSNYNDILFSYRQCLQKIYDKNHEPNSYILEYRQCVVENIDTNFEKFRMGRLNEDKVFLPMKSTFIQQKCIWLTVGIGGDDKVEELFKKKYPACQIFGIEAESSQYANFDKYGTIIPYGVGVKNETTELILRTKTNYKQTKVEVLALPYLLDKFVQARQIHYMTIDIEGFEFGILEALLPQNKLYKENIVFCQVIAFV
uniref:Methyltransferase FkbM domain-containing protein n=1 Tax=Panagrolaimus superbus TaxID=310955 RepID=A0A914ZB09_9BILA